MSCDLSVLIPARHEQFLKPTVEDVLKNRRGKTEVIVVCDGEWPTESLVDHPDVQILYRPVAIGQRAATNDAARLSNARWIMKLDAHCSVAPGFDVALMEVATKLGERVVQIPRQYHLHIFNWKCQGCGTETYQGPTPARCATCESSAQLERVWLWERRQTRWRRSTAAPDGGWIHSDAWRFDSSLHFQYFPELQRRKRGTLIETMSCLGACWFLERDWFFKLGGLDEAHGSWGQMGTEIACKAWLSGGRLITNRRTWYAHLFRTQGGDFGFPYQLSQGQVEHARAHSQALWLGDRWPGQVRPLRWLVEKFAPLPGWTTEQIAQLSAELPQERAA